eukprot:14280189-Ditylum_brightwellii.AAC.1
MHHNIITLDYDLRDKCSHGGCIGTRLSVPAADGVIPYLPASSQRLRSNHQPFFVSCCAYGMAAMWNCLHSLKQQWQV